METCFFAAQTMRSKIQNSFQEVPADKHGSLRSSLLAHLAQPWPATNQAPIVTKLCEALADLVLLMPEWTSALSDIMAALSPGHTAPLLELLLLLPEEVDSRHLRLGANRRQQVRD